MFAAGTALFLAAALALDIAGHGAAARGVFTIAGIVFLVLAVFFPHWPQRLPRPDRRRPVSLHEHVPHPHLAHRREHGPVTVADARPSGNPVTRFNTRAAVIITRAVGSMWAAYAFTVLALYGLPAALHGGPAGFVQWASSQFIQLVLLPIILVGSAVLAETSDRLAKRQFDDVEALLHGQSEQAAHLAAQDEKILAILEHVSANMEMTTQVRALVTAQGGPQTPKILVAKPPKGTAT